MSCLISRISHQGGHLAGGLANSIQHSPVTLLPGDFCVRDSVMTCTCQVYLFFFFSLLTRFRQIFVYKAVTLSFSFLTDAWYLSTYPNICTMFKLSRILFERKKKSRQSGCTGISEERSSTWAVETFFSPDLWPAFQ